MPLSVRVRDAALAAASAALAPVVLVLAPLNSVLASNVRELRYDTVLVRELFGVGAVVWLLGWAVIYRLRNRLLARLWMTLPWAILLLDVAGGAVERRSAPIAIAAAVDALVLVAVIVAALRIPARQLQTVAATVGIALLVQGAWAHASYLRALPPEQVLGGNRVSFAPAPPAGAPGNVYHIILDNYLSESFAYSAGADAPRTFRGFTFFTRFNSNFPRTESAEPAIIAGRPPTTGTSMEKWPTQVLADGLWKDLSDANVGLWIYPYGRWLCPGYARQCLASSDIEQDQQIDVTRRTTVDLLALRLMPASIRLALNRRAASARGAAPEATAGFSLTAAWRRWRGDGAADTSRAVSALPTQYFNIRLFDTMLADEAKRPPRGQYVYYHALLPHPPYIMNERCEYVPDVNSLPKFYWPHVACANLLIERLVRELARLGRLDDALVIVQADHGDMEFLLDAKLPDRGLDFALDAGARRYQQPDDTYAKDYAKFEKVNDGDPAEWRSMAVEVFSSALLLVKQPHATMYSEDARPVQSFDIAPTVLAHFGVPIPSRYAGVPIGQVPAAREMHFFAHNRAFSGGLAMYRLTDDGWKFVTKIAVLP